jgi:hypothetical protein
MRDGAGVERARSPLPGRPHEHRALLPTTASANLASGNNNKTLAGPKDD